MSEILDHFELRTQLTEDEDVQFVTQFDVYAFNRYICTMMKIQHRPCKNCNENILSKSANVRSLQQQRIGSSWSEG